MVPPFHEPTPALPGLAGSLAGPAEGPGRPVGAARPPALLVTVPLPDRRVSLVVLDPTPGAGPSPATRELIAQVLADLADSGI